MATIKNKTRMRKGGTLYTEYGDEVTIEEITALSNKVLYLVVRFENNGDFGGYSLEYIAENSASTEAVKRLRYLGGFDELYVRKEEQERREYIRRRDSRKQYVGGLVIDLVKSIK